MRLRSFALALAALLGAMPLAATAQGQATIRMINVTNATLTQVDITPCQGGGVVAGLARGETVRPYQDRTWTLPAGCYVLRGAGLAVRVTAEAGRSHDAQLR